MSHIHELNRKRTAAELLVESLGVMNQPTEAGDQLKASAQYRMAYVAWLRAEMEYSNALNALSGQDLQNLAGGLR